MQNRLRYIDIAKGFAIICVVIGHVLAYDVYGFTHVWNHSPLVKFICTFHMPLFLFLSGLVASTLDSYSNIAKDLTKRFRLLIVPFFVIGSIYSLAIYNDLSFINNDMKYGYWYLLVLFYCYIFNYLLINNCILKKNAILYILLFCAMLLLWKIISHISQYVPKEVASILSLNLWCMYFPYFLVGFFVKRFNLHSYFFNNSIVFILAAVVWSLNTIIIFPYSNYIVTLSAIIVIINICYKIDQFQIKGGETLEFIGLNTLYIYVFHYFALQIMKMHFLQNFLLSITPSIFLDILISIVPTIFAIFLSLLIYRIISSTKLAQIVFGKNSNRRK